MEVYHGSTYIVEKPDLNRLNYKTDFGKGFYTTTDYEQAKSWTRIKKKRQQNLADNDQIHQYINVFDYVPNNKLNILSFESATKEWLEFIMKNRKSEELLHSFDIVEGPVANDNLYRVIVGYEEGVYDIEETIARLKTYLLAGQISFHTDEALKCLKYKETIEVNE